MTTTFESPRIGRIASLWAAAHEAVPGVPRWARIAAYAVPFTVLPASLWRIAACTFHAPIMRADASGASSGLPGVPLELYVLLLSIFSELVAFTSVGLVARWGEAFPRWVLPLRGRRVPVLFAVVPAALASIALTVLWTWVGITMALGIRVDGTPAAADSPTALDSWQGWLCVASYAPLVPWGPLLGLATVAYWRRRRGSAR